MYTLRSWRSLLGIVAVDQSHQEYPVVMLDPRAINKSVGFESPGFRAEHAQNPPCLPGFPVEIRDESARFSDGIRPIIFNWDEEK